MKTLAIASGKGGAGKTSVAAAISAWFSSRGISGDCDVDAANGAIALGAREKQSEEYWSGEGYEIEPESCSGCGLCAKACRFGAIRRGGGDGRVSGAGAAFLIDEALCERCGACVDVCPAGAVKTIRKLGGRLSVSDTRFGSTLVHAELVPGEDTSGKLVRAVRLRAEREAGASAVPMELMALDAPPGIGCPVIASLSGVDLVLVVIEAGSSGVHDAARLFELLKGMGRRAVAVINKAGLDPAWDDKARRLAAGWDAQILAELPFDARLRRSTERGEAWVRSNDAFVRNLAGSLCAAVETALGLASEPAIESAITDIT